MRLGVRFAAAAVAAVLVVLGVPVATAAPAGAADDSVRVQIVSVFPHLPEPDPSVQPVAITAIVTNTGSATRSDLTAQLRRASQPITQESLLAAQLSDPTDDYDIATTPVAVGQLAPGASRRVVLRGLPNSQQDKGIDGLCLCSTGIYPITVAVGPSDGAGGVDQQAKAVTYLPNFTAQDPATAHAVQVSWVWPLIDKPHRELTPDVFVDDSLGRSVAPGGRLYRALIAASAVDASTGMTLLVDPDLIDALTVMTKGYRIKSGNTTVRGTLSVAAANWLRLFGMVAARRDVSFTAYGDPDVDALTRANLRWTTTMDSTLATTITRLIGRRPTSDLAWPVGGEISNRGMDALVDNGASQVVLSDDALPAQTGADQPTPNAITSFTALTGQVRVAVTDSALERSVSEALGPQAGAADGLQTLLSQLAARAMETPGELRYAVLTPSRYVDVDPVQAVTVMNTLTRAPWSAGTTVARAAEAVTPVARASLVEPPAGNALPGTLTDQLSRALANVDTVRDVLSSSATGSLLSQYAPAVSRAESSWWRRAPGDGEAFANRLVDLSGGIKGSVRIIPGSSYTLASSDAPLYITVQNKLRTPVTVVVHLTPAAGERGISAKDVKTTIEADSRNQVAVPTSTDRSGRFQVNVQLLTPTGTSYDDALPLRVHSTALGGVAVTITAVAFGVLLLTLAIRLVGRLRRRGGPGGHVDPARPDPVPSGPGDPGDPRTPQPVVTA